MTALLVALGAAIGAPLRYLVDRAIQARHGSDFPWGTMIVNIIGSFVLGLLATAALSTSEPVMALLGTGFCGALTTYSTFGFETIRLLQSGANRHALANAAISVVAGVAAAYAGLLTGQLIAG